MRITAQLIRTGDRTHFWAREFDRDLTSVLIVQSEIAQEIADEIQITLGSRPHPKLMAVLPLPGKSYEAYDQYLKGRYFWNKRTGMDSGRRLSGSSGLWQAIPITRVPMPAWRMPTR
jgi:hypothetical protein